MKITLTALSLALLLSGCSGLTTKPTAHAPHWGYHGNEGPEHWGALAPEFALCGEGKNQSPVNLSGFVESELPALALSYAAAGNEIVNNGHTVQVNYQAGSQLVIAGHSYALKQFHFHSPSENRFDGKAFPLEAHLVHADESGNLAVLAVMFEEGGENAALKTLWSAMPHAAGEKIALPAPADASQLLPTKLDYYRFNGSLTTPPCSEGVLWLVLKQPVAVSAAQVEQFSHTLHHDNNRPLQPLNARAVLQ